MSQFSSHLRLPCHNFPHTSDCLVTIFLTPQASISQFYVTPQTVLFKYSHSSDYLSTIFPQAVFSAHSSLLRLPFHCFSSHLKLSFPHNLTPQAVLSQFSSHLKLSFQHIPHSSDFLSTVFPHTSECPFYIQILISQTAFPLFFLTPQTVLSSYPHSSGCLVTIFLTPQTIFLDPFLIPQAALSQISSHLRLSCHNFPHTSDCPLSTFLTLQTAFPLFFLHTSDCPFYIS